MKQQVLGGLRITEEASSWVYQPGLSADDDPDIALVWERVSGLRFDGSRAQGREVGFVGGYMRQIPDAAWEAFLRDQTMLRENAKLERTKKQIK